MQLHWKNFSLILFYCYRKKKKVQKEKRKLRDKMSLKMVIPGDQIDIADEGNLFDLKHVKTGQV